jgi:hypothetical protein
MKSNIRNIILLKNKELEDPNIKTSLNNSFFWAFMYGISTWGDDEDILSAN